MRLSWLLPLAGLIAPITAASSEVDDGSTQPTIFNGQEVPPLPSLNGETLDQDIKTGYWYAYHDAIVRRCMEG